MSFKTFIKAAGAGIKAKSPLILVTTGIGLGVVSVITACKATTKVEDILDEAKIENANIDTALAHPERLKDGETYTEEDAKNDRRIVKVQTGKKLVKNYAIPIIAGVTAIICVLGGYKILNNRNVALTSSLNAVTAAFAKYRERVISEQGAVMDRHFRYGTKLTKTIEKDANTGEEREIFHEELPCEEALRDNINPNLIWDFCRETSPNFPREFDRRPEALELLIQADEWLKNNVKLRGKVLAAEVCDLLNLPTNEDCYNYGWLRAETEEEKMKWPEPSLGINEIVNMARNNEVMNGYDMAHQESYPVIMNAMKVTSNPIFHERYRPYKSMTCGSQRRSTGRPSVLYNCYAHNFMKKVMANVKK